MWLQNKHMIRIEKLVREGVRPDIDVDCPPGLASLIRWCWVSDPDYRPTAAEALEQVMKADVLDPMLLDGPIDEVSPLAANRTAEDPLLCTTPNCHVKKGYPNTDGVNNVLSANRFAAKRFRCSTPPSRATGSGTKGSAPASCSPSTSSPRTRTLSSTPTPPGACS